MLVATAVPSKTTYHTSTTGGEEETIALVSVPSEDRYNFHDALVTPFRVKSVSKLNQSMAPKPPPEIPQIPQKFKLKTPIGSIGSINLQKLKPATRGPSVRGTSVVSFDTSINQLDSEKNVDNEEDNNAPCLVVTAASSSTVGLPKVLPVHRQNSSPLSRAMDDSSDHLEMGLKWDSSDYAELEIMQAQSQLQSVQQLNPNASEVVMSKSGNVLMRIARSVTTKQTAESKIISSESIPRRMSEDPSILNSRGAHTNQQVEVSIPAYSSDILQYDGAQPRTSVQSVMGRNSCYSFQNSSHMMPLTRSPNSVATGSFQGQIYKKPIEESPRSEMYTTSSIDLKIKPTLTAAQQAPSRDAATIKDVKFNSIAAWAHWLFLCAAFDEKGRYISIKQYHSRQYRRHLFWNDGFHERSLVFTLFNLFIICFYFLVLIYLPFEEAYFDTVMELSFLSWSMTGVFLLDSMVNFLMPIQPSQRLKKENRIKLSDWYLEYLKSHVLVDIISIVPWVNIVPSFEIGLLCNTFRLLRVLRLPSVMAKNAYVIRLHNRIENVVGIGNMLTRMIPVGLGIVVFVHIQCCIMYYCGKVVGFTKWNEQFWHWTFFPGGIEASGLDERYVWMLTQALGNTFQITHKPQTIMEQIVSMLCIIFGALLYAYLVGLISSAAISFDASGRLYRQKIDELTDYLNWKNIDEKTQKRLLEYYEFKYRGKYFEEKSLLNDMNASLRMELATINCSTLIEKVPFLKRQVGDGRDTIYLGRIATALNPVFYIAGDFIVIQGEQATEMFFIQTGKVNILVNGHMVTTFSDGAFFGEVALIANIPRTASVQAATSCQLYSLSAKDFNSIIMEFDDMKQRIDSIYEERMEKVRLEQAARIETMQTQRVQTQSSP
ncbi:hypothetical protein BDR26DRAFT_858598 [Obelidium mucronatum]|nr:hypothetical protein BDR26DRAFT_858598 [Obelidium mucronatum]